ncbi:MAG: 1-deoxy-D-xylulose-5-phosphate reductoisomerase [Clostridia bacterium]
MIKVAILGSTGSIGTQTLSVIEEQIKDFQIEGLTAHSNSSLLKIQAKKFKPNFLGIKQKINLSDSIIIYGNNYINKFIEKTDADIYVNAISGIYGLEASIGILKKGKDLALANKESIVSFGELLINIARENDANIYPVDSEHSAIWQCLQGEDIKTLKQLIITASGGPFRDFDYESLKLVQPEQALKHPTWSMGQKISIDSATLMNKGLEVIEASILYNVPYKKISVLVHPQSIVHSLVEFNDGALIAQLGTTDMRQAIQYALYRGKRVASNRKRLDLAEVGSLDFHKPNTDIFRCLKLAYEVGKAGGVMPAIMNTANNIAVEKFLDNQIKFLDIPIFIEETLSKFENKTVKSIDDIINIQKEVIAVTKTIKV